MMYNLLRINVLMNIFRKLLSSAVLSCSLIVLKSLIHSYQCMHCACMLRLNSPETCLFMNIWPLTNVWPIRWQASKSWPNPLKLDFRGGRLIYPLHCYSNTAKNNKILSSQTWSGVVKNLLPWDGTPDLPPEGGRSGVLVRISQKIYFQGVPAPWNRFLVIPSHFKNMIRICQKIYLQEVNQRVLPP